MQRSRLRFCFDPCNLLLTEQAEDIADIVESVSLDDVSMIHVKQRRDGRVQPDVGDGDLNWSRLLESLEARVRQLEDELRRVERERDILKKALAIFGRNE